MFLFLFIKGKPRIPVINNKKTEINGCNVNLTWSSKNICIITKHMIRYRERKSQGYSDEWIETTINKPTNNFHELKLDCNKNYEIAVSLLFGELKSGWSTSWQVATNSGLTLPFVSSKKNENTRLTELQ